MIFGAKDSAQISPSKLRSLILGGVAGINLFIAILSSYSLYQSRQIYEERAWAAAEHTAEAIDNSLGNSIDKIDLTLHAISDDLERQLIEHKTLDPQQVDMTLRRYQERVPDIEAIRIANTDGLVIFGKGLDPKAGINWSDRDYFQYLRDHPDAGLFISKPVIGRIAKKPIIGLARRYNAPNGHFAGVISAPVAIDDFNRLLSRFVIGPHGAAVLRDSDWGLIARYPPAPGSPAGQLGNRVISHELRALIDSGASSGTFHTERADDQIERTNSFRRVTRAPIFIIAGVAAADYLDDWYTQVRKTAGWMAAFLLLSLLAAFLLLRLLNRALQESLRNQLFLRHSSDGIHILNESGNIIQTSDQFCAMLGYQRDEMLGMNVSQWDARWSKEELLGSILPEKLRQSEASNTETLHRCKDGSLLEIELNLAAFEMDGQRYLFASARDIGERKRQQQALRNSEARLRQSEERYRLLLNHLPVGVLHVDSEVVVTYANARFEKIMQLPPGRAHRLDCKTLKDQAVLPAMRQALAGKTSHYEGPYLSTYSQQQMMLSMSAAPVFNSQGDILGAIVIVEDITERRQAEARLRLAASVFAHAHEGIVICNAERVILDVNPTFSAITGYSREEAIGKTPHLLSSGRHDAAFFQRLWEQVASQGFWEGELWNKAKNGNIYAERLTISSVIDAAGKTTHYIGTFSDISVLKEQRAQLEHLAHYDALTNLPNRTLLAERMSLSLAQAKRAGTQVAVCYLDLDGFKEINDVHGHDAGDILLLEVANRLRNTLRTGDTAARLGGDEFVLLFTDITASDECRHAVARVLKAIAAPVRIKEASCCISASIGISLYPDDDNAPDTLLRHADQAMYLAKQEGKNRCHFYDATQEHLLRSQHDIVDHLRQGLRQGELTLHYQPIVDMRQGTVLGVEGLLRWQHPERGLLLPGQFLPACEGSEIESEIGDWVLNKGLRQLDHWHRMGLPLQMNLNIAAGHLLAPDFIANLSVLLATYPDLPARYLELEVLEAAAMSNLQQASDVLHQCQKLGVSIAIDDFGTGYSSLVHFRRLPANTLKIDQALVLSVLGNEEDIAIVDSVIRLTEAFSRKLIAEGIENMEIGMLLLYLGCSIGQGFGIARPMPAAEIPAWAAGFRADPDWALPATSCAREDIPLLVAELDHRQWVKLLENWLLDEKNIEPLPPLEDSACRFGHWCKTIGQQRYGSFAEFQAILRSHQAVHDLGNALAALRQAGNREALRQQIDELHLRRDQLIEQIAALQATATKAHAH